MSVKRPTQKENDDSVEEPLRCPEKPKEDDTGFLGSTMLFYKDKGSENLGLCYGVGKGERCNCDKANSPKGTCNDNLWI